MGKDELEGLGPEPEQGLEPKLDTEGDGGQEPRSQPSQEDTQQPNTAEGEIDLEALPASMRALIEDLREQIRKKNREARSLRKRLKALEEQRGKTSSTGAEDDLQRTLEELRQQNQTLQEKLRQHELAQAVHQKASALGFRPEAVDEIMALVRARLGDEVWDNDGVDGEALSEFLEELRKNKRYLLKPKPQKKPTPPTPPKTPGAAPGSKEQELRVRFGL